MEFLSADMARAAGNCLAFLPARSKVKNARLRVGAWTATITATDGYTYGSDEFELLEWDGKTFECGLTREGLTALDSHGRADKKGRGKFTYHPNDCLKYSPNDPALGDIAVEVPDLEPSVWTVIDVIAERAFDRDFTFTHGPIMFDPSLLMRFSKVKPDRGDRHMDMFITDPNSPVVVKIGATFRGMIMPIHREVHGKIVGEEGLWPE